MDTQNVTVEQVLSAVAAQRTKIESMATLLSGLRARLNNALQGELSPAAQARLNEVFSEIQGNTRALSDAYARNDDDPSNDPVDPSAPAPAPAADQAAPGPQKISTTTVLSTSAAVANVGDPVTLTATVSPDSLGAGAVTGEVVFAAGSGELGRAALDSTGVAAYQLDAQAGDYAITATYSGDDNYAASTSASVDQSLMQAQSSDPVTDPAAPAPADATQTGNDAGAGTSGTTTATTDPGTQTQQGGDATPAPSDPTVAEPAGA